MKRCRFKKSLAGMGSMDVLFFFTGGQHIDDERHNKGGTAELYFVLYPAAGRVEGVFYIMGCAHDIKTLREDTQHGVGLFFQLTAFAK